MPWEQGLPALGVVSVPFLPKNQWLVAANSLFPISRVSAWHSLFDSILSSLSWLSPVTVAIFALPRLPPGLAHAPGGSHGDPGTP